MSAAVRKSVAARQDLRNVRLVVAYDGTDFRGSAESDGVRTVMGELRRAIERVVRHPIDASLAGRTDAGVHAWGQVVSCRLPAATDLGRLAHSLNGLCGPDVVVRSIEWVDDGFDARFSATSRAYRYEVWNSAVPHPGLGRTAWHVHQPLDLEAMNAAAAHLLGEHDFASFCRRPDPAPDGSDRSLVRRLDRARWRDVTPDDLASDGRLLRFEIAATSFCHQMVRSIVGTLVEVGRGRRPASSLPATLAAADRSAAGAVAPPTGLTLWHVSYDGPRWDD